MPRRARLDAPGTLPHVMIRGIEGKGIFRDTQGREDFVTRTRILAWSLLGWVRAKIAWILSREEREPSTSVSGLINPSVKCRLTSDTP